MSANPRSVAVFGPQPSQNTLPTVLFATEAGDTAAISVNDIHQGQLGDCFLLSAIGEVVLHDPALISSMIHANGDGTETVALYTPTQHGMVAGSVTVNNSFSSLAANNAAGQDVVGGKKEIWVQVLEKAYATARGGYFSIVNGGSPVTALESLTGHVATAQSPASLTQAALQTDIAANDLIVMDTHSGTETNGLVANHAYMFEGLKTVGGTLDVQLGNPWGFDNAVVPLSQLAKCFTEVDVCHIG